MDEKESIKNDSPLLGNDEERRSSSSKPSKIDRGWAWVIMFACFMTNTMCMGYVRTFGILFVEYRENYGASAATTSLTMGLRSGIQSITALLVHNILLEFITVRAVVAVGGFVYGLNIILKVFAPNIMFVILTECILAGAAHGMVFSPTFVILGQYFHKYRSFATAFATCGSSLGGMMFAPMLRFLLDEEGYWGALLIYGALMLNIIPAACLFRPLKADEMQKDEVELSESEGAYDEPLAVADIGSLYSLNIITASSRQGPGDSEAAMLSKSESNILSKSVNRENQLFKISASASHVCQVKDLHSSLQLDNQSYKQRQFTSADDDKTEIVRQSFRKLLLKMVKAFDFRLFQDCRFLIISAFTFFGTVSAGTGGVLLPPLSKEIGLDPSQSSNLLVLLAAVDLCGRFTIGIIADRNWIRKQNIVIFSMITLGVTYQFTGYCTNFPRLVAFTVIMGIFSGSYFALLTVILIDIVGLSKLSPVLGFVQLYGGISGSSVFPILGLLRDSTGSYVASYQFIGACSMSSATFLMMEPLVRIYRKRRFKKSNKRQQKLVQQIEEDA